MRYGKCPGHHRGHRPEHVFTGLAWELGRAICLLVQLTVRKPYPNFQAYEVRKPRPLYEPYRNTKADGYARYQARRAKSEQPWDGLVAVLVDHSTAGHVSVREGGEPRPTGPTVGKEKPGITRHWRERWMVLRDRNPCQRHFRNCESKRAAMLCARWSKTCLVMHGRRACVF